MDYIFYRLARFFFKGDGKLAHRALIIVSTSELLILIGLAILVARSFLTRDEIHSLTPGPIFPLILYVLTIAFNFFYYRNKYEIFERRWESSETPKQKYTRGVLVVVAVILPYLLLFYIAGVQW